MNGDGILELPEGRESPLVLRTEETALLKEEVVPLKREVDAVVDDDGIVEEVERASSLGARSSSSISPPASLNSTRCLCSPAIPISPICKEASGTSRG